MNTMKWLIKREMWEHKGMLLWAPLAVAGVIAVMACVALLLGHTVSFSNGGGMAAPLGEVAITDSARAQVIARMTHAYMASSLPLFMMLGFLVFYYCLGALHDERRDRSILFWKSLPVSDRMTVLSKAALALAVAPLLTIAVATALSLLLLLAACVLLMVHGSNLFGALLLAPDLYLMPLRVLGLLPVHMLWALPTVGWLLMVSSMARSKVFLWAVGGPLLTALLLAWADQALHFGLNGSWFMHTIAPRILLGVVPGSWFLFEPGHMRGMMRNGEMPHLDGPFEASWASLGSASLWLGVAAGMAMLAVAVWMRHRRAEG